jgi:phage shock protein PspC (stress-responsive transcriptional regulator)
VSQVKIAEKRTRRALWPVAGFFFLIVLLVISYLVAPFVIDLVRRVVPRFSIAGTDQETVRVLFAVLIFLVSGAVSALIVALSAPRNRVQDMVKDAEMVRERQRIIEQKKADRQRQRELAQQSRVNRRR